MTGNPAGRPGSSAETDPRAEDPRLRGRTYAISFDRVWSAAEAAASGGKRGWTLVSADDQAGILIAEVRTSLFRRVGDARIEVGLDENGQTRLDVGVVMRGGGRNPGTATRIVASFVRRLDASLQARPEHILDATQTPSWSS